MKIIEIVGNLRLPVFNEEVDLIKKVKSKKLTEVSQLTDRERVLTLGLVRRNVLNITDNKIFFNGPQPVEGTHGV